MSTPDDLSDEEARWRDATQRAAGLPSDRDLTGSTRGCLIVVTIGLSMAVIAVAVFFGAPALLDTSAIDIAAAAALAVVFVIGGWAYVKRFGDSVPRKPVLTPLTPPQRRLVRGYMKNRTAPTAAVLPVVVGYARQQRQGLVTDGLFAGWFIAFAAYNIATHSASNGAIFWFCYLIGVALSVGVGALLYRRYGEALDRAIAATTTESV